MSELPAKLPPGAEDVSSASGFNRYIGPIYRLSQDADGMGASFGFIAEEKHMNAAGSVHGGMLMSLADVAMGRTARLAATDRELKGATISLTADFVGPGRLGDLIEARVRVTRRTRTLAFMFADIVAGERPLMVATGLWKIG